MTEKKKRPARKRPSRNGEPRPKQTRLPGFEEEKIPAIEKLACEYAELRDERMRLWAEETARQDLLQAKMKEHGRRRYEMEDGRIVEIVGQEKVKVRKAPKEEEVKVS